MTQTGILSKKLSILLLTLLWGLYSCQSTVKEEIIPSAEYAPYVSAYTGGGISQTSSIRVEFAEEQPNVEIGAEVKGSPFTFTPSLKGKAYWSNDKTIEFVPEEGALRSGILYKASFKLGDFVEVEKHLQKFEFTFQVMERNFSIDLKSLYIHASDPEVVTVKGELRFSDAVNLEDVQKMITLKASDKQSLKAEVSATDHHLIYAFEVNNVKKGAEDVTVTVEINGAPLKIDKVVSRTVVIPAKSRFVFLSANRITEPENGIEVVFSEPISTTQNLKGLIVVDGVNTRLQVKGNIVHVYFEPVLRNTLILKVNAGITSETGKKLTDDTSIQFVEKAEPPQVMFVSSGTILPNSKGLVVPFRAISLYAVDVSVIRIFENNVLMFLQDNSLEGSSEIRRSGRLVYRKMLRLGNEQNVTQWGDYSIDLSDLIAKEPGAIYRVMLSFRQEYSAYPCGDDDAIPSGQPLLDKLRALETEINGKELEDSDWDVPSTYYNLEYEDYDWQVYDWEEQDNPCSPSYYMNPERKVFQNLLATDLGMIVKSNTTQKVWVAVNNMLDTSPVDGAEVTLYNFQLQPIGKGRTDANGFAKIEPKGKTFVAVASHGKHKTYLRMVEGEENSISRFDVGGKQLSKGLKGYIYGERGVWRPGDTLHVSFILEDREKRISDKHPVSFELYNPRGQFYTKTISTQGLNGFYTFHIPTKADDPTGMWSGYVKVGGSSFYKGLRVETIKPNRLKINLAFPQNIITGDAGSFKANLFSSWLTGATAANLKSDVEMRLSRVNTTFPNYSQYNFNNPATQFEYNTMEIFKGSLNSEGKVDFDFKVPNAENAPGMLQANITTRVYEPGGDASIMTQAVPFSPFNSYVGINLNQPSARYIETDTDHVIDVVTLSPEGKPMNRSNLEYKVYRVSWSWWWERGSESFSSYVNNSSYTPIKQGKLSTVNGKAQFTVRVNYPSWGRYLVYVKDKDSGHAAGGTVYIDWPESRGRSKKTDPDGVTMLAFNIDKETYETGETVTVTIPAASEGRALVSIENGTTILSQEWVKVSGKQDTKYQFKVTPEMAPNIFLHITLLQPHAQTVNELPIRMYGVMPVSVHNKETILEPQIKMPDVLLPEQQFSINVTEKNGKAMTYTLAIVDDGLLDITNFKTPDPWAEFYAREALGISTWDMYDQVIGAFGGRYSTLYATGGDEALKGADDKANRFRPIVKYLGPFELKRGATQTHTIKLPMYVGSVRTMVVAGQSGAYGKAEKTTQVRSPLMILSTLPRVLSTGEDILLPVNVFAMDEKVKDVTVTIETSPNLQLTDGASKSVKFSKTGDQLLFFKVKTGFVTQKEIVKITARGNGESTTETIEIDVRNPNPFVTLTESKVLNAGQNAELKYQLGTKSRDNWVKLEVARIPPVDISRRLDYLYSYQHCCTEQLTSKALPLLFVSLFKDVDAKELDVIKKNVQEAIRNLYGRQLASGGFAYWPGDGAANEWVSSYAGTFLVMAQEKGYAVNPSVLNKWKNYQRSMAKSWAPADRNTTRKGWYWQSDYQQAYRLYSLALAGAAEQGAMNRLKEVKDLALQAKWRLAAAYALSGQQNPANEIVFNVKTAVEPYSSNNNIYGSYDRDEAMILETLVLMGRDKEAFEQAKKVSKNLLSQSYFSTQSTAYALMAMGRLAEKLSGSIDFDWTMNGAKQTSMKSAKALYQTNLPIEPQKGTVTLKNNGNGSLYVDLISRTQLLVDTLPVIANNLRVEVRYIDMAGKAFDIDKIKQGTDFKAIVKVSNISGTEDYRDIALTHMIPSGWEIYNERLVAATGGASTSTAYRFDYQDIRDDRVLTYFSLDKGRSREITIRLQATYAGEFVLPAIQCEAMYDVTAQGRTKAGRVVVER